MPRPSCSATPCWPADWPRCELTWWIIPEARRSGYAFEASRAVIAHAYDVFGWDLVETHMNDENVAARNLALKLGGHVIAREIFPDGVERNVYALPTPSPAMVATHLSVHWTVLPHRATPVAWR